MKTQWLEKVKIVFKNGKFRAQDEEFRASGDTPNQALEKLWELVKESN